MAQPACAISWRSPRRQGRNLLQGADPLLKHGLDQLAGPVRGLPKPLHYVCKLLTGKAKKIFAAGRAFAI